MLKTLFRFQDPMRAEELEEIISTMLIRGILYWALISFRGLGTDSRLLLLPFLSLSFPISLLLLLSLSAFFEPSETCSWSWEKTAFLVNVQVCAFIKAIILHNERLSWKQVESEAWKQWYSSHAVNHSCGSQHVLWLNHVIKQMRCNVIHNTNANAKEISLSLYSYAVCVCNASHWIL